jgi:hypothetical protein
VITGRADQAQQEEAAKIRVVYRALREKVPEYVSPEADRRCDVPVGYVRMYNAAVAGVPAAPDDPAQPNDAPSGVALSTVAATDIDNLETCQGGRRQLINLQDLLRALGMAP